MTAVQPQPASAQHEAEQPANKVNHPLRRTIIAAASLLALAGAAGVYQLATITFAPPIEPLAPWGIRSRLLPAGWLFATVVVPSGAAAWLAWRRSPATPRMVMVSAIALGVELVVQIPFVGFSPLQVVMGAVAVGMALIGWKVARTGWK